MTFMDKVYTLRTEVRGDGKTAYFISFADGQGEFYDLEVSEPFFVEFRQMERKNRNLQNNLTGGIRKRQICGMKRSIIGRSKYPKALRN